MFDRLFAQLQGAGDFLVGLGLEQALHQLLFAGAEASRLQFLLALGAVAERQHELLGEIRGDEKLPGHDRVDSGVQILGRAALEHEGVGAGVQRLERHIDIGEGGEDDDLGRAALDNGADGRERVTRHAEIEGEDVGRVRARQGNGIVGG